MSDQELLRTCFHFLEKDLDRIENYKPERGLLGKEQAINNILDKVYTSDPDDGLLYLSEYQDRVDNLIMAVPSIINGMSIKPKFEEWGVFQTVDEAKCNIISMLMERLGYYHDELIRIRSKVQDNLDAFGSDKFAAAGFKLRLNLTHPEIADLFRALLDSNLLAKEDGSALSKKDLARFISSNFTSATATAGVISVSNLANLLSEPYAAEAQQFFKKLAVISR